MNTEKHHNLIGFNSYTAQSIAAQAQHVVIDGVSGFDLLRRKYE